MKKILFVCSGNTCRSPMASALFNALQDGEFLADSAGIGAFRGDAISRGALDALRFTATPQNEKCPFPDHLSKPVTEEEMDAADYIYGITKRHTEALCSYFPHHKDKIRSFPQEIPDPFGRDTGVYLQTLAAIRSGIFEIYRDLKKGQDGIYPAVTERDIFDILAIEKQSFSTPWSEKSFRMSLENPITHAFVKMHEGKVVGYALYSVLFEDCELYNIAVSPENRGQGIGNEMLSAVLNDCLRRGGEILRLEVRNSNLAARSLYRKFGFIEEGIRKNYYQNPTEDAILMHLSMEKQQKETL